MPRRLCRPYVYGFPLPSLPKRTFQRSAGVILINVSPPFYLQTKIPLLLFRPHDQMVVPLPSPLKRTVRNRPTFITCPSHYVARIFIRFLFLSPPKHTFLNFADNKFTRVYPPLSPQNVHSHAPCFWGFSLPSLVKRSFPKPTARPLFIEMFPWYLPKIHIHNYFACPMFV